jgi:hypothetical protein
MAGPRQSLATLDEKKTGQIALARLGIADVALVSVLLLVLALVPSACGLTCLCLLMCLRLRACLLLMGRGCRAGGWGRSRVSLMRSVGVLHGVRSRMAGLCRPLDIVAMRHIAGGAWARCAHVGSTGAVGGALRSHVAAGRGVARTGFA